MVMLEYTDAEKRRFDELASLYLQCRQALRDINTETGMVPAVSSRAQRDEKELLARERSVSEQAEHLITFTVQTYLHAASEHMGGLGALYLAEEVLLSPLVLARTSVEHSSHAVWIIGSSADTAADRLARAYLEEIHSAEHAKMHASRVYGMDSAEYRLRRGHFREVKAEAKHLFDPPHHDDHGIPICQGLTLPSPEDVVLHMNRAATRPLTDDEVSGTYALLSSHVHPTTHIIRELFDVRKEQGLVIPRLTRDITYHERLARLVVTFFYNAVTYVTSYHGWAPTSHHRLTDLIDRYLPDVFGGDPRPGPFDTSA